MPLDTPHGLARDLHALHDPVRRAARDHERGRQSTDGLVVQGVHVERVAEHLVCDRVLLEGDRMNTSGDRVRPRGMTFAVCSIEMLQQRATERNVEDLHPPADGEDRKTELEGAMDQRQLHPVTPLVDAVHGLVGCLAVEQRIHIATAGQHQSTNVVQHLDRCLDTGQHDGSPSCGGDSVAVCRQMEIDLLVTEIVGQRRDLGRSVSTSAQCDQRPPHDGESNPRQGQAIQWTVLSPPMVTDRREANPTEREQAVADRVGALHDIDFAAMNVVQNVYRVANAVRARMEREALGESGLSWTSFTALFVLWVWGPQETRHLAEECGVTKGTLTGVLATLESKGLVVRAAHETDGRLVVVRLTPAGRTLIKRLFPQFNAHETQVVEVLSPAEQATLTRLLRKVLTHVENGS